MRHAVYECGKRMRFQGQVDHTKVVFDNQGKNATQCDIFKLGTTWNIKILWCKNYSEGRIRPAGCTLTTPSCSTTIKLRILHHYNFVKFSQIKIFILPNFISQIAVQWLQNDGILSFSIVELEKKIPVKSWSHDLIKKVFFCSSWCKC